MCRFIYIYILTNISIFADKYTKTYSTLLVSVGARIHALVFRISFFDPAYVYLFCIYTTCFLSRAHTLARLLAGSFCLSPSIALSFSQFPKLSWVSLSHAFLLSLCQLLPLSIPSHNPSLSHTPHIHKYIYVCACVYEYIYLQYEYTHKHTCALCLVLFISCIHPLLPL